MEDLPPLSGFCFTPPMDGGVSRVPRIKSPAASVRMSGPLAAERFGTHGEHDDHADDDLLQEG